MDADETALLFLRATPRAQLRRSSTQSINNATNTAVQWNSEAYDTHNGHDTVTNNSRYTAPYDGVYQVQVSVPFADDPAAFKLLLYLQRSSDSQKYGCDEITKDTQNVSVTLSGGHDIALVTGEYVQAFVYQNSGSALNISTAEGGPCMSIRWVGA